MRYGDKTVPKLVLPPTQRRKKMNLFNYYGSGELKKNGGFASLPFREGGRKSQKKNLVLST